MTAIVFKKGEFTMGKSANTFTGEGFDFFGFLENGLFGDKISALFDADSNMGRIITMIAAFIIAAAVLMIAAENLRAAVISLGIMPPADRGRRNRERTGPGSCICGGGSGNGRNIYCVKRP